MFQYKTILNIADNSGIKKVQFIKAKKNKSNDLLVSIFERKIKTNIKKGTLFLATIVREKMLKSKKNGFFFRFDNNSVILINSKNGLVGTRFFGPIFKSITSGQSHHLVTPVMCYSNSTYARNKMRYVGVV